MKKIGKQTVIYDNIPKILESAAVVGPMESEGPLGREFDVCFNDSLIGEESWEKAESKLQKTAVETLLHKSKKGSGEIDFIFAGDLLNQCIASSFGIKGFEIPFVGLYGACSTMALSLINASLYVESGAANHTIALTSSHFCSAERQYRFPLEYGGVRPPTSQWTVTGSGAILLGQGENLPQIASFTIGKITDYGIKDANNMGAAMAPAAADTIKTFFEDTGTKPQDYDVIFTGDLGRVGTELLYEILDNENINLRENHKDCGNMIFDPEKQDVHAGGSGCGCSASVLCSHILNNMRKGIYKNILFCATGALMSPTSTMQGQSIPCIAHLVNIKNN